MVSLSSLARTAAFDDSRGVSLIPATEDTNPGWTTKAQCPTLLDLRDFDVNCISCRYRLLITRVLLKGPSFGH